MKAFLSIISLSLALVSCHKDVLLTNNTNNFPSIQSFILAGSDSILVKVSTLAPYTNDSLDTAKPLTGLKLYINNYLLTEQTPGTYIYTSKSLLIHPKDSFILNLAYNNKTISSNTVIPSKPLNFKISSDTVSITQQTVAPSKGNHSGFNIGFNNSNAFIFTWDNPFKDYHYIIIQLLDTAQVFINSYSTNTNVRSQTTTPVNQDNAYDLTQNSLRLYGKYRAVLYKINKEYYNVLQTSNLNSNAMTNPPSNITNGWGIFTGISTDTLYFSVLKR